MTFNKKIILIISFLLAGSLLFAGCSKNTATNPSDAKSEPEISADQPEGEKVTEKAEEQPQDQNYKFISAPKLNVRESADPAASIVDSLIKGSKVTILEKISDSQGSEWYKAEYTTFDGKKTGFISAEYTVDKREDLLGEDLRGIDLSSFEKIEYSDNKRVKVRGIYVTIHSAAGARLESLLELAENTDINAFVIDVKDDYGTMLFKTDAAAKYAPSANDKAPVKDIDALLKKLKEKNIYTIARIVSFKDPTYASYNMEKVIIKKDTGQPFVNSDNITWVSPHDRNLWDYNISVAKEAAKAGFNEIQFDYVRFPASNGGKLDAVLDYRNTENEGKPETIQNYLKLAYKELSPEHVYISADVYGLVGSVPDDMQLGQYWESVSNYTDYISPMMYPSHYANGTYGVAIPDADPYATLFQGAKDAVLRNQNLQTPAIIRPWIQSFTASWVKGHISYGPSEIDAQIKALRDAGVDEYLLWNASNKYNIN